MDTTTNATHNTAEMETFFKEAVQQRFASYANSNNIEPTQAALLEYLLRHDVINQRTVKRYVVVAMYPNALAGADGSKMQATGEMEDLTGYSRASIYNVLKDQKRFAIKKRVDETGHPVKV